MASKGIASLAVFLALNLLLSALADANPNPNKTACPRDALGVSANVLSGLVSLNIGQVPLRPCCSILFGLVDLEAAMCLCTAIKANAFGHHSQHSDCCQLASKCFWR